MATDSYLTIDAPVGQGVDVEMEIKRSRFLTRLRRVTTEDAAREVILERRKAHYDATHNCTAFVLGPDRGTARSSDDGEPAGTAGVPMLGVLHSSALSDVVAVVTRYFGGIKLGGGGLVRAYSDAVAQAVEAAGTRTVAQLLLADVEVDMASAGQLEESLRGLKLPSGHDVQVTGTTWSQSATIRVAVPPDDLEDLNAALAALTRGAVEARSSQCVWTDLRG